MPTSDTMADGIAEPTFPSSTQNEATSGDAEAVNGEDAQIDSSDEYDPSANTFQDVSHAPSNPTLLTDASAPAHNLPSTSPTPTTSTPVPPPNSNMEAPVVSQDNLAANVTAFEAPKQRLPHDRIGILEDRIAEDEKGDLQAWLELIEEYKKRGKIEDERKTYDRFFVLFPSAADERVAMVQMENDAGNKKNVETIFSRTLKDSASLKLWSAYMNHIRRYHDMTLDKSGKAAQVTYRAYQVVLDTVGQDKDSGTLWQEYIAYLKTTPGVIGGTNWQDSQKMDVLRAGYQQAIVIPHQATESIWTDYTNFETGINKQTGRKFIQDKSPDYMQARTSYRELQNITRGLVRTTLPHLPPAPGFEGHEEYMQQLNIWNKWIEWEKSDPLVIKSEDDSKWKKRVVYVYKQALMALRFWPEMWLSAAEFAFDNNLDTEGDSFLLKGVDANPESALLAFRRADRLETSTTNGNDEDSKAARGLKVRAPFDTCLDALYALLTRVRKSELTQINATDLERPVAVSGSPRKLSVTDDAEGVGDAAEEAKILNKKHDQIAGIKRFHKLQVDQLQRTITHVWIALMRAFQRMQGIGNPTARIGGSRGVFGEARKRGQLTSDLFTAAAMLEYHGGVKETAVKIFARGSKMYPKDGGFALDHVKFLVSNNDTTNARVAFETAVTRFLADENPEVNAMAKPLFVYFHSFESKYGELSQVMKLEARMKSAFPEDTRVGSFATRFSDGEGFNSFNPTGLHQIISPTTQCKQRLQPIVNEPDVASSAVTSSPRPAFIQQSTISSPKRPLPADLADLAQDRISKVPRGESPLKGAAGRRQAQANAAGTPLMGGSAPLPQLSGPPAASISFLLGIIPPASTYHATRFNPEGMVRLIQNLHIPTTIDELNSLKAARAQAQHGMMNGGQNQQFWVSR